MAKPINDDRNNRVFGNASGRIQCSYHNGTSTVTGYIVKQLGTNKFRVSTNGSTFFNCKLAQTTGEATALAAGQMTIRAFATGGAASLSARYAVATVAVNAGGTGYSVGNVLTVALDGTNATFTVTSVNTGAITGISITTAGLCTALPGTLQSTVRRVNATGGAGTGAILDLTFKVDSVVVVSGGSGFTAGQALNFVGLVGGSPAATIGSVDANGAILTVTVGTPGTGIHTAATSISMGTTTKYVKRIYATRILTTDGLRTPWNLTAAALGVAKLDTI